MLKAFIIIFLLTTPIVTPINGYNLNFVKESTYTSKIYYSENFSWFLELVDEDPYSTYFYASNISNISANPSLAGYSYRSAGSIGEAQVYDYLVGLLKSFGLNVSTESFDFMHWSIPSKPWIWVDFGNGSDVNASLYPMHYTFEAYWDNAIDIAYLPLPKYFNYDPLPSDIESVWNSTNIANKIVLIGYEVYFNSYWVDEFFIKMYSETPAAILFTWATENFSSYPKFFPSNFGRGIFLFKTNRIPTAWIDKWLAKEIINAINDGKAVKAMLRIPVVEESGVISNIIATIDGLNKSKTLLITAHYDSIMVPALCDNGAGVAALLEIAWALSKALKLEYYRPPINIMFVLFTAEELGLLGSAKFLDTHKDFVENNVVAVINLDTLGSYKMEVAKDNIGFMPLNESLGKQYLHNIAIEAASELGVQIEVFSDPLHSDDSTFANPRIVQQLIDVWWPDLPININDAKPKSATMIGSKPYLPWHEEDGKRGWIHTPYDNTTSTKVYGWVEPTRLETQTKVAGLTILKTLQYFVYKEKIPEEEGGEEHPPAIQPIVIIAVGGVATALILVIAVYFKRRRKEET